MKSKILSMTKIKPKECQNIEFKRVWKDEFLKWICGFANAQGAVMYFGVDDNHEVVGLNDSRKLLEDIPNKIRCESPRVEWAGIYRVDDRNEQCAYQFQG